MIEQLRMFVSGTLSIPYVSILLQLSPFIAIIDEFSYFAYHSSRYDQGFIFIVELCWEINNAKWVPPCLTEPYSKLSQF